KHPQALSSPITAIVSPIFFTGLRRDVQDASRHTASHLHNPLSRSKRRNMFKNSRDAHLCDRWHAPSSNTSIAGAHAEGGGGEGTALKEEGSRGVMRAMGVIRIPVVVRFLPLTLFSPCVLLPLLLWIALRFILCLFAAFGFGARCVHKRLRRLAPIGDYRLPPPRLFLLVLRIHFPWGLVPLGGASCMSCASCAALLWCSSGFLGGVDLDGGSCGTRCRSRHWEGHGLSSSYSSIIDPLPIVRGGRFGLAVVSGGVLLDVHPHFDVVLDIGKGAGLALPARAAWDIRASLPATFLALAPSLSTRIRREGNSRVPTSILFISSICLLILSSYLSFLSFSSLPPFLSPPPSRVLGSHANASLQEYLRGARAA
ncbi:hypothetical protein DFH06DRAFT_210090, partial [Mycena polygramma]